jgi:hypothetical protein
MVTRQAIEPAVAANAPTATPAIEPDCTAKTLAIETGAAKQPSNQAIAPPCTAIALADPAIELEDIKEQIIAHVIERRDEIPCGADVELIAHAFAKELADDIFFIASSGTGTTVTEMIKSNVATVLSVSKLTLDLVKKEEAFAAISDHAPKPTPLVFVQLAVVSSLVGTGVATVLQVSAPEVTPEPTAAAHMTEDTQRTVRTRPVPSPCVPVDAATALAGAPSSSAGVPHGRPPGDIWAECDRAMNRTGALMMFGAGPTIANGGSDDDPDLLRIAEVMNEANLPSADLIMQMPTGVTYNEYIEYIMRLTSDQITELVEEGSDSVHGSELWSGDEPYAVHIILVGSNINEEILVDDVFDLMPDDTTPANFARACVLMGETMRTALLTQRG